MNMSGMQGASGAAAMPKNCSIKSMHNNTMMKSKEGIQPRTKEQIIENKPKIYNPNVGTKLDIKI
ncbi:hypothetical protein [Sporosalibacterium faouarense]|uniref:hypothetical protein n=1 Tax=Sporosalibacterium faouarense TaxID=516123 RepID=UPI00192BF0CA|nr:hypothetical protein [Sporosalibacterium faouarense]